VEGGIVEVARAEGRRGDRIAVDRLVLWSDGCIET
jgi:hypothetical protein